MIHNAAFDVGFLNAELARTGHRLFDLGQAVDTLALARRKHPGAANNLDALCSRYGIDNSRRTKHGALLDAEILAEVYIELIGGKQTGFDLSFQGAARTGAVSLGQPAATRSHSPAGPAPDRGGAGRPRGLRPDPRSRRPVGTLSRRRGNGQAFLTRPPEEQTRKGDPLPRPKSYDSGAFAGGWDCSSAARWR